MEPGSPSKPTRLPALLHWLAWGLVAAALLRTGLMAFYAGRQLAWLPWEDVSAAGIVWGVISMVVRTSGRLPDHDRRVFIGLASVLGLSASGISQQAILDVAQLRMVPIMQLAGAGIASILSITTLAVNPDHQEASASRALQACRDR